MFLLRAPEPIYVAALLTHGGEMHWGLKIDEPAGEVELTATFSPWRFRTSEGVQVDFEGRRTRVTDAVLKQDARDVATITAPASTRTGEITEVLSMPGHAITLDGSLPAVLVEELIEDSYDLVAPRRKA